MFRPDSRHRDESRRWAQDLLERSDWVILDTETTGLDRCAEAIQIAILAPDGAPLIDTLVRPHGRIPPDATAIHGITDEMVASAPTYPDVHPRLEATLEAKTVIAYNAAFDRRILLQTCLRNGARPLAAPWECAMEQYARFVGQWSGRNGGYVWQRLPRNGSYSQAKHQAIDDCLATLDLIKKMATLALQR